MSPIFVAISGRLFKGNGDRIPELFMGEVVVPEQVDVFP
jgi:hypothetical protein